MSEIQNYKCPACGGMLQFSSREQKLVCANCKSSYDVAEFEAAGGLGAAGNYQAQTDNWNVQADGLVTYACKTCGGEVVGNQSMASTKCPYCDSPIVIAGQFSGAQRPDAIIPFKLNKHAAKEKLKQHMTSAKMVPSVFSSENHLQELKGVYVPFWLYDADVHAQATFEATKEKKWSDAQYNYTETSYFNVMRGGNMSFRNIPADASKKFDDKLMDSIEPFNTDEATAFSPAYLAGYLAEKYDVSFAECMPRADERIKNTSLSLLKGQVKDYKSVNVQNSNYQKLQSGGKYALFPVWLLNTTWNGKKFTFAMNGQTGKMVGDLPFSIGKFFMYLAIFFAVLGGGISALMTKGYTNIQGSNLVVGLAIGLIISLIICFVMKGKTKSVHTAKSAIDCVVKGSFRVTEGYDNFMRTQTDKKPKNTQQNS